MLLQEGDRTAPGEFGGSLVVPAAGIVIEGVIDARIDVDDVTLVIGLKRRFKIRDPGINALIKPGIMQQQRCTDRWHLRRRDLQSVIDDGGLEPRTEHSDAVSDAATQQNPTKPTLPVDPA